MSGSGGWSSGARSGERYEYLYFFSLVMIYSLPDSLICLCQVHCFCMGAKSDS